MTDAKKKSYEPPRLVELELDLEQAAGQTACTAGTSASGPCVRGRGPRARWQCHSGANAQRHCQRGNLAGGKCQTGSTALGSCRSGRTFGRSVTPTPIR